MHYLQEEIGIPKIKTRRISDTHAQFVVAPLPPGYGMTIGNAFRRVLLSSLPGAAVTGLKIEGVNYEYASIKGVKESVLDIILNLKLLQLKKTSKAPTFISLKANKEGEVTAKDIQSGSDVEILNPDLYITTLNKGAKLNLQIRVEKGVGYLPVSQMQKTEEASDIILVDAFFSPVKKVHFEVEATRIGPLTNLDKLTLEIVTNGAISPEDSLKFASNLLKSYFNLFNIQELAIENEFLTDVDKISKKQEEEEMKKPNQEAYTPIEILNLSPRTLNALINGEIGSIEQLVKCTPSKLANIRGFGKKALTEVSDALSTKNLALAEE